MNSRKEIADFILERLLDRKKELIDQFKKSNKNIGFFYIDNLLPEEVTRKIYSVFPELQKTVKKKNIREYKYVAYQMDKYNSLLEEVLYAFQDVRVVRLIGKICNIKEIYADEYLYAGGLSLMQKENFLNPHLDNSHDKDRNRWRVLNLLFYVTPNWKLENGGNLELWNKGVKGTPLTIESKFNRLVVMVTHQKSWHSVSKVNVNATRCCVSNYYFSNKPVLSSDAFHVTAFKGRPNEKVKDYILNIDYKIRSIVRGVFKKGIRENSHQYKK